MTVSFTISTVNYLPFAKSLGDSFTIHNPGREFIIILVDELPHDGFNFPYKILTVGEMGIENFEEMNSRYSIFELSCAMKPFAAHYILDNFPGCDSVFYFDCDILLFAGLHTAEDRLREHSVLLTPHLNFTKDYTHKDEVEIMTLNAGVYNAGFFGVSKTKEGYSFLEWWKQRMRNHSYIDMQNGLFVDQVWLNLVPGYFENAMIIRDPGYNAAFWNLGERSLSVVENKYLVNEKFPLVFFHFSGFDIHQPEVLTRHLPYFNFETLPDLRPLFDQFRNAAIENNAGDLFSMTPQYGKPKEIIAEEPIEKEREKFFKRKYNKLFRRKIED